MFSFLFDFLPFRSFSRIGTGFGKVFMASSATVRLPGVPIEEGLANRCWIKFRKEAALALYTPFVVSLASGNLKFSTFQHYIAQDVHFLRAFVKAYGMAEECAEDDDAKAAISELKKSAVLELDVHDSLIKQWGFCLLEERSPTIATVKYIDFLMATASGKIEGFKAPGKLATPFEKTKVAAYTIGAMTPCMRLYAFLGKELQVASGVRTHSYQRWIDYYSSDAFQAGALQTENLLDKLCASLTGEELDIIEKLYYQAMKLEINFFLEQPLEQKTIVPLFKETSQAEKYLMLFSDFDLTCSVVDSSAILAEIAIRSAPEVDQNNSESQRSSSADLRSTLAELSKQYTEEYEQCVESILSSDKVENFNYEVLCQALELLSSFEKKANKRVIESGVLKGLKVDDIKRAGEHLILLDGCVDFFRSLAGTYRLTSEIHVLSCCWCGDLIRSSFISGGLSVVNVHANEFVYENSLSTGEIATTVESPIDKIEAFDRILNYSSNGQKILTVYIGDSLGDLLCLIKSDIGIVIGSSLSLRRVGSHFGVSFVPLFQGVVNKQKQSGEEKLPEWKSFSGVLYTVSSWAEIYAFFFGS